MSTAEQWNAANEVRNKMMQARIDYANAVKERDELVIELAKTYKVATLARMFKMKHQNVSKLLNRGAPNVIEPVRDEVKEIAELPLVWE